MSRWPWEVAPDPKEAGGTAAPGGNPFARVPTWLVSTFGLRSNQVPSNLLVPNVMPVVETRRGLPRIIVEPNPAVGATSTPIIGPTQGFEWVLLAFSFRLTTDATVANREVEVQVIGRTVVGPSVLWNVSGNFLQPASENVRYNAGPAGVVGNTRATATSGRIVVPFPIGFVVPFEFGVQAVLEANPQAGDQFQDVRVFVLEYGA